MALVGNMIASANAGNPSIVNYDMFVAVFGMLSLIYLIPATFKEDLAGHPLILVGLDVLNSLFFFCGAVAMAAKLHTHSCGNSVSAPCFFVYFEASANIIARATPTPTASRTELVTPRSDATRPKQSLPSFGSALQPLLSPPSSLASRVAAPVSACAAVWVASAGAQL